MRIAGTTNAIFSPEAVHLIYTYSRGIPRTINLISEHSLILGYVEQIQVIPGSLIAHVAADLELDMQTFLMAPSQPGEGLHSPLRPMETGKLMNSFDREPGGGR